MDATSEETPVTITYLVERYWPGVAQEEARSAVSRIGDAVSEMGRLGTAIRHVRSTFMPVDESVLCLFEATSAEDVAEANRRAGVQFDRISPVVDVVIDTPTESDTSVARDAHPT